MKKYVVGTILSLVLGSGPAYADGILFDFNSLANDANNTTVQTYMNGVLGAGKSVALTGSTATKTYNGEGHVIGPGGVSLTLGTEDGGVSHGGANDTFLYSWGTTQIQMLFTGLTISNITFDYQIFPDDSCSVGACSSGFPDFTFTTSTNKYVSQSTEWLKAYGAFPVDPNDRSPLTNSEKSAQKAPAQVSFSFATPVNGLRFIDWPPTIGIDNVCINSTNKCKPTTSTTSTSTPTSVTSVSGVAPEPTLLTLLGAGAIAGLRRRFRQQA
ncbi:MAG: hypothetical protein HOP16_09060 [Acidobacteria bacterium]|nr:hypothetical protein [Acidobacteriota bacterium]